jgi:hypothetical protein
MKQEQLKSKGGWVGGGLLGSRGLTQKERLQAGPNNLQHTSPPSSRRTAATDSAQHQLALRYPAEHKPR